MPCRTACPVHLQRPKRKVKFVLNDDQVCLGPDLQPLHQVPHRTATQIHERFGLCQDHRFGADCCSRRQRPALPVSHVHIQVFSQLINGEKTQIVRRQLVFPSRIAKSNNQLHAVSLKIHCLGFTRTNTDQESTSSNL